MEIGRPLTLCCHPCPASAGKDAIEFAWDEDKRRKGLEKQATDFQRAARLMMDDHVVLPARNEIEPRHIAVGFVDDGWLAVVDTWRGRNMPDHHGKKGKRE